MKLIIGVLGPFIILVILFALPISLFSLIYFLSNYDYKFKSYETKKDLRKEILLKKIKKLNFKSTEVKLLIKKLMWLEDRQKTE